MNSNVVLIYVDQSRRDLYSTMMIKFELEKLKMVAILCNYHNCLEKFIYHRPKFVILGNTDLYHNKFAKFFSNYSVVLSLPTEQAITNKDYAIERIIKGHSPGVNKEIESELKGVSYFFIWSRRYFDWLNSYDQFKNKLIVTGSPRPTLVDKKTRKNIKMVGFALEDEFNNVNITSFFLSNFNRVYHDYGDDTYKFVSINIMMSKIILNVLDKLYSSGYKVCIRPRMMFDHDTYSSLLEKYPDLVFSTESDPYNFFNKIDILVLGQSSIGTEAQYADIPVISVAGLIKKEILSHNEDFFNIERVKNYWTPSSMDKLVDIIKTPYLPISPNLQNLEKSFDNIFGKIKDPVKEIANFINHKKHKKYQKMSYDVKWVRISRRDKAISFLLIKMFKFKLFRPLISLYYFLFTILCRTLYGFNLIDKTRYYFEFDMTIEQEYYKKYLIYKKNKNYEN